MSKKEPRPKPAKGIIKPDPPLPPPGKIIIEDVVNEVLLIVFQNRWKARIKTLKEFVKEIIRENIITKDNYTFQMWKWQGEMILHDGSIHNLGICRDVHGGGGDMSDEYKEFQQHNMYEQYLQVVAWGK